MNFAICLYREEFDFGEQLEIDLVLQQFGTIHFRAKKWTAWELSREEVLYRVKIEELSEEIIFEEFPALFDDGVRLFELSVVSPGRSPGQKAMVQKIAKALQEKIEFYRVVVGG